MYTYMLKPCRYCGGEPDSYIIHAGEYIIDGKRNPEVRRIVCRNKSCGFSVLSTNSKKAADEWNRRANDVENHNCY